MTDTNPQPYSVRLPAGMRKQLEDAAREEGRSLHAEILLRLESSLLSGQRLEWRNVLDPTVYFTVRQEAIDSGQTIEKVIGYKLLQACDSKLSELFLEDLSSEVAVRRMKKIEEMKEKGEYGEGSFIEAFKNGITMGQVLDERLTEAVKKRKNNPNEQEPYYPFYGLEALNSLAIKENELFVRSIVREELAKAGIKPVDGSE